ncbi:hypothetical protein QL285_014435 [Trifolium repens]|nr:hypothetical protein QL285_014435 [Trifolium repens]
MEKDRRLQLIDLAIQKHIHDKIDNNSNHHNLKDYETEYQLVLSQLLSVSEQLELSKRDETINQNKESNDKEKENEAVDDGGGKGSEAVDDEEIIKEVKKVKKQNFVTHCLLSAMIVLTVAWQLSEVSLVWKVKEGINDPFRSFGNMVKDTMKDVKEKVSDFKGKDDADDKENNESTSLTPSIMIPDITNNMDVPNKGME